MNLKYVELEIVVPWLVRKLVLTETSEMELFGEVKSWRNQGLPPLYWMDEESRETVAYLEDDQTAIYNKRQRESFKHLIKPGIVKVIHDNLWDLKLENIYENYQRS